jgi:ADP-ribose pyrophosphatase
MTDDEMIEHKIDGEVLYEGRILRLEVDRIRFADGGEGRREVVRHGGAVVLLPLTDDGRVLLVRQYRYPTAEILLELPAGTLERGEEPAACAARELEEETGHRAGELISLGAFYSAPGFSDEKLHGFLARGLKPSHELTADDDEHLDLVSMPVDELFKAVADGVVRDAKTLATLLLARSRGLV